MRRLSWVAVAAGLLLSALPMQVEAEEVGPPCVHDPSVYESPTAPPSSALDDVLRPYGQQPTYAVNDPLFPLQWGVEMIKAPHAWARGATGKDVVVAVIDTGVDFGHPDLAGQLLEGIDLVDVGPFKCTGAQDEHGHGTMMSGLIAAVADNGIGVAGASPRSKILPIRIHRGSSTEIDTKAIAEAITWAADYGAPVISMSLGVPTEEVWMNDVNETPLFEGPRMMRDAVAHAWAKGAVVVAVSHNQYLPLCQAPGSEPYTVCVGAVDRRGNPTTYSQWPNKRPQLDQSAPAGIGLRAPGGIDTVPGPSHPSPRLCTLGSNTEAMWTTMWPSMVFPVYVVGCGRYRAYNAAAATSEAVPFVASAAAMLMQVGLTNEEVLECFATTSVNTVTGEHGAWDPVMGFGVPDMERALDECVCAAPEDGKGAKGKGGKKPSKKLCPKTPPGHQGADDEDAGLGGPVLAMP